MLLHKEDSERIWDNLNREEVGPRSVFYRMAPSTKQVYIFQSMSRSKQNDKYLDQIL